MIGSDNATFHASNPLDWNLTVPHDNWVQPWTITGGNLVLNQIQFMPGCSASLGNFVSPGIEAGKFYQIEITFGVNLAGGPLIVSLNGNYTSFSTAASTVILVLRAGNITPPNLLGGLWITTAPAAGVTGTITDIQVTLFAGQYGVLGDLNASTTGQNALVYTDSYTQEVKYFSYQTASFTDVLVDSATVENTKEPLVLKDDDGSATSEISPIIYSFF